MIISLENIDGVVGVSASVAGMNAPEALLALELYKHRILTGDL